MSFVKRWIFLTLGSLALRMITAGARRGARRLM